MESFAQGSFVLFNSFTPHRSLPNLTDAARFSFDLRYQDARLPHGMGKNGGLVQLRSADPGFEPTWEEGPLGPPLPVDDEGRILPQWPSVGPEFTPVRPSQTAHPAACLHHGRLLHTSSFQGERTSR